MRFIGTLLVVGTLCFGGPAGAQPTAAEPASIPVELARTMMMSPFGEREPQPRFFVGVPPGGLPSAIAIPENARVVGGRMWRSGTTAIIALSGAGTAAIDSMAARMLRAGWSWPPTQPHPGFMQTGPRSNGAFLCRDSSAVMIFPAGRGMNVSYLSVTHRKRERNDACEPRMREGRYEPELEIPVLTPPAGVRSVGVGGGGGGSDIFTAARLETTLDASALLAHYAPQLRAAGWTVGATTVVGDAAVAVVEARDSRGQQWRGLLGALSWPNEPLRKIELRMSRPDPR